MKIYHVGNATVIKSAISYSELALLQKVNPEAMTLRDKDGDPIFRVAVGKGSDGGSINSVGIEFRPTGNDEATVTEFAPTAENFKEEILDKFGAALGNLLKIEESAPAAIEAAKEARDKIAENIEE